MNNLPVFAIIIELPHNPFKKVNINLITDGIRSHSSGEYSVNEFGESIRLPYVDELDNYILLKPTHNNSINFLKFKDLIENMNIKPYIKNTLFQEVSLNEPEDIVNQLNKTELCLFKKDILYTVVARDDDGVKKQWFICEDINGNQKSINLKGNRRFFTTTAKKYHCLLKEDKELEYKAKELAQKKQKEIYKEISILFDTFNKFEKYSELLHSIYEEKSNVSLSDFYTNTKFNTKKILNEKQFNEIMLLCSCDDKQPSHLSYYSLNNANKQGVKREHFLGHRGKFNNELFNTKDLFEIAMFNEDMLLSIFSLIERASHNIHYDGKVTNSNLDLIKMKIKEYNPN